MITTNEVMEPQIARKNQHLNEVIQTPIHPILSTF